ncbi:MAG: hypothetical protein J6J29_00045, partial [Paludibacteraceae bacterium]|nr:hypothetical protein [Paludibacteraceae bacterium]
SACAHQLPSTNYQLPITNPPHRVPKSKPRLCLFAFGKAEVRVAFNDRAERYHSRNLVTERDTSSKQQQRCSPITIYPSI